MKLAELEPRWVGAGGDGATQDGAPMPRRERVGLTCNCPCGCADRLYVPFANPLDGGPQVGPQGWDRTGDTFETLTLTPSILRLGKQSCGWHGWVTAGEVRTC